MVSRPDYSFRGGQGTVPSMGHGFQEVKTKIKETKLGFSTPPSLIWDERGGGVKKLEVLLGEKKV